MLRSSNPWFNSYKIILIVSHSTIWILLITQHHQTSNREAKIQFRSQVSISLVSEVIMPKLIDSEIRRIDTKAKEISTAYSLFLLGQKKFRVLSN